MPQRRHRSTVMKRCEALTWITQVLYKFVSASPRGDRKVLSLVVFSPAVSVWTITNLGFDGKEVASSLAPGQFPWDSLFRENDKILKRRESADYSDALVTGQDCNPCAV